MFSQFSMVQLILLLCSFFLLLNSLVFHLRKNYKLALIELFLGGLLIFIFAILLDPFLNPWDERFHALVAKNMMDHPLKPMLYTKPILDMAYDDWDRHIIWLHKQPLFLWQISLSFKLFGVNEIALRLPSAIMSSIVVLFIYRIGTLLVNRNTGYYSALITLSSYYLIELVSGRQGMEHNDVAFIFYVAASIWAWLEYLHSTKKYWIVLIGMFAGGAVLCKWLVGLLVYLGWSLYTLLLHKLNLKKYIPIVLALAITALVVLPWQLYALKHYPKEAKYELKYNSRHFTEAIEGHGGPVFYHFKNFKNLYGNFSWIFILPALFLLYRRIENKKLSISITVMIFFIYLFFSLAKTKLLGYPFVIAPLIFISFGNLLEALFSVIQKIIQKRLMAAIIITVFIFGIMIANMKTGRINTKHGLSYQDNHYSKAQIHNKKIFLDLKNSLPANSIIFNVKGRYYIDCMFYTSLPSYQNLPNESQYQKLKGMSHTFVALNMAHEELPDYLNNDQWLILNENIYIME